MVARPYAAVLVFHNGYGDYVLALPALRAFAATLPRPSLLVADAGPARFLVEELGFDHAVFVPFRRTADTTEFDCEAVLERAAGCELFVAPCPWASESLERLNAALRPGRSLGFGAPCTELVDYRAPGHECDVLFAGVRRLAPAALPGDFSAPIQWPARTAAIAGALRAARPRGSTLLVAHVDSRPGKSWPVNLLDEVLAAVVARHPGVYAIVLNAAPASLPRSARSGRVTGLTGLALDRAMSLAGAADLFVGVDSCMLHVADLCRRPGVGLFGPTQPARHGFRWSDPALVRYVTAGTMAEIGPAAVTDATLDLLGTLVSPSAAVAGTRG